MYHDVSHEASTRYVAHAITDLLQRYPDLCWTDMRAINDLLGWDYDVVRGEQLGELDLMRAWQLAREQSSGKQCRSDSGERGRG